MSVNGESRIFDLALWLITARSGRYCLYTLFDYFWMLTGSWRLSGTHVNEISWYCPGGCRRNIPCSSAYIGCLLLVYGCLWSSITHSTEDARAQIVDAPSTIIFKMGQGVYPYHFCIFRRPIIPIWLTASCWPSDYPGCKTKNLWHYVDAHFQDAVGSV